MNTVIKEEFLQVKENDKRKRWYTTMECQECNKVFTTLKKQSNIETPCEACKKRLAAYHSFIAKAGAKHGDRFSYELVTKDNYISLLHPVSIICQIHGVFLQKPKDHVSKTNGKQCCHKCIQEFNKLHNKRSIASWKEELCMKHHHIQITEHGNADSNTEKCSFICEFHGAFVAPLASIKNDKYLCTACAQENNSWGGRTKRIDVPGILYHIKVEELGVYKVGVTSTSITTRFRQLKHKYSVIWQQEFDTLREAYKNEAVLLRKYSKNRNKTSFSEIPGYTEFLNCEIPITALQQSNLLSKES